MDQETVEPFAPLIEQAADAMRADPDTRWHAVADLLRGGPLGYAQMIDRHPNRERMVATYLDGSRGAEVARAYLATSATGRVEWAAELRGYDGGAKHTIGDEEYARLTVESIAYHLSTLNEATRREGGVESAVLVRREVRKLAGGTLMISPWREVKED